MGKILNKYIAGQRTKDRQGNPGEIFGDITAGTFIPFPLGIGQGKVLLVDKIWNRIIMMDRDILNGEDTVAMLLVEMEFLNSYICRIAILPHSGAFASDKFMRL